MQNKRERLVIERNHNGIHITIPPYMRDDLTTYQIKPAHLWAKDYEDDLSEIDRHEAVEILASEGYNESTLHTYGMSKLYGEVLRQVAYKSRNNAGFTAHFEIGGY